MKIAKTYPLFYSLLVIVAIVLMACTSSEEEQPPSTPVPLETVNLEELQIKTGQVIHVPAYSEIFNANEERTIDLAITLAIRNTDLTEPIFITSVHYYDTDGNSVKEYVENPLRLGPMATTGVVIAQGDKQGGVGASFIVEWVAEQEVNEPTVEAIMINTRGTQGLSFISRGRVLKEIE